jgi:hypothetical protein
LLRRIHRPHNAQPVGSNRVCNSCLRADKILECRSICGSRDPSSSRCHSIASATCRTQHMPQMDNRPLSPDCSSRNRRTVVRRLGSTGECRRNLGLWDSVSHLDNRSRSRGCSSDLIHIVARQYCSSRQGCRCRRLDNSILRQDTALDSNEPRASNKERRSPLDFNSQYPALQVVCLPNRSRSENCWNCIDMLAHRTGD